MQRLFVCVLLCALSVSAQTPQQLFEQFVQQYRKLEDPTYDYTRRFEIFAENLRVIQQQNTLAEQSGKPSAVRFGINQFTDLTQTELRARSLPRRRAPVHPLSRYAAPASAQTLRDLPTSFDWRDHGVVTDVRDQGTVGTCWAFSATEAVESQWAIASHPLTQLAVEQVVDCDATQNKDNEDADCGVFGGWPYLAYEYVMRVGGLTDEKSYPYCCGSGDCFPCQATGYNATRCGPPVPSCNSTQNQCYAVHQQLRESKLQQPHTATAQSSSVEYKYVATISNWTAVSKDENEIAAQLVARGPLSILIDSAWLSYYTSGIWPPNDSTCSSTDTDHAVVLVGYAPDYWIVRNSWGASWGQQGYFWLKRGINACAMATGVTVPIV